MIIEMRSRGPLLLAGDNLCRLPLERDVLPDYLKARRWFDSKADAAPSVTIEKSLALADLADAAILILGVKSKTRTAGSYLFPVRTLWECERPRAGLVCELRSGPAAGWLVDGFSDDRFVRELLDESAAPGSRPKQPTALFSGDLPRFLRIPVSRKARLFDPVPSNPTPPSSRTE